MYRFTPISTFTLITLLTATTPIPTSSHEVTARTPHTPIFRHGFTQQALTEPEVTARTPHNPVSQPHVMNNIVPTAHKFHLKVDGFKDKTIVTFGKLESMLTLQIPLSEIDPEFYNWIKTTSSKSKEGQGDVTSNTVRTASLISYNAEGKEVLRWNLTNTWVRAYKAPIDAASQDSAVATLEMAFDEIHQGEQREKVEPTGTEGSSQ